MKQINWLSVASVNMALAVSAGAFAAHGLKNQLSAEQMAWWQTGTQYFFYHALGLLIIGLLIQSHKISHWVAWLMQIGILLFVGTLYLLALGLPKWLGMITPIGGTLLIVAWLSLAVLVYQKNSSH